MKIREALQMQTPSLALQRAASDEIARLDAQMKAHERTIVELADVIHALRRAAES